MASGSSSPTTERHRILEDILSCGICFEPFTKPKALPCQHSFCLRCLERQHKQWLQDCRRTPLQRQEPFRCSICREPVTLTSNGVAGLPDNHLVANLCEEFSKKTQVGGQKNRCGFHPTKDVDLFCQQCEVPVCSACIREAHSGHIVSGVQLNNGHQKIKTLLAFLKRIEDVQNRLTDNKTQAQQEINKAFEVQMQKLREQRDGLLATVHKSHQDNMAALTAQKDIVLTQLAELSRVCEDAEECLEQEDAVWLTQDLNLEQKLAKFEDTQTPEICETKLCSFEPKKSGALIELGKVTLKSLSDKQALVQSKDTNTGHVRSTNARPTTVGQTWVRKVKFGGEGSGKGQFCDPCGVAVPQDNKVYIADRGNSRIQVLTKDGVYVREFTTTLPGDTGGKLKPWDIAVDSKDNLWVVGHDHEVQYSREGICLAKIDLQHVTYLRGVTVAMATEQVIVTEYDGKNGLLRVFNQDGSNVGMYVAGHRSPDPLFPRYVVGDVEGNILVTDLNNHCVRVLDTERKFKFKFGSEGSLESQLNHPEGICVDGKGNIIVADSGNGCVKMFDSQGRFLCDIASGMKSPHGVAVSPGGDVVVTDYDNQTVSVWTQG
ncbi:tripartite motif-containing protein 2-like [Branchiostoma floridae x Branchiostoma japonicum]